MTAPWDPEVLERIRRLRLVARRAVDSLLHGGHRSLRTGSDVEFAEYKEYAPGDPLRHLDWRVYARSDRLVIRRHEAETDLQALLVLDASADAGTGHAPPTAYGDGTKLGHGVCLAATLATFLVRQGDRVGLQLVGGEVDGPRLLLPRGGRTHLAGLLAALAGVRPAGRAGLGEALASALPRLPRRSLVVLVSDFMEPLESWAPTLAALGRRHADLLAFHLLDRREMGLAFDVPTLFYSPEGGDPLPVDAPSLRRAWAEVVEEWRREVRAAVEGAGGIWLETFTDEPLHRVLRRAIDRRGAA